MASYLRGKRYNGEKKALGGQIPGSRVDQNDPPIATADKLAVEYKVSPATIKRDGRYAAAVDTLAAAGIESRDKLLPARAWATLEHVFTADHRDPATPARGGDAWVL